ncbi:MAG: PAS domain S-box protein [Alphaproteobacteria bacterium]|nr:PAS domain S-box protein [Alphaproteobacteria bacterium]
MSDPAATSLDAESARLEALGSFAIIDTEPEEAFDRITRIVSTALDTPMAFVTFVEAERVWFKSAYGAKLSQCERTGAFCTMTITQDTPLVIEDTTRDARFCDNPFVTGPTGIRFYAGAPLQTPKHMSLGSLCVFDTQPRVFGKKELCILEDMAALVVDELELRRATHKALNETEKRFRDFATTTSDWFWEVDRDLRFSYFSKRFTEITGVPAEWLLGKTRQESGVEKSLDPAIWQSHLDDLAAHRPFRNFVHPRTKANGQVVWLAISGVPYYDDDDVFLGYRGTGADVTQQKLTEDALRDAKDRAERADTAKTEFVANMSHELRTPLNAIIGFSDVMKNEVFGEIGSNRYLDYAKDINASGTHLLAIINDILDVAKIDTGEFSISVSDVDIRSLLRECEVMIVERLVRAGLTLETHVDEALTVVRADTLRLRQVLLNLLTNAIKFTPAPGKIAVTVRPQDDGTIGFTVADTGMGIAQEDIARILEPFTQAITAASQHLEGTGLGLYLTKHLVEKHGGHLIIDSDVGVGTSVTFSLPSKGLDQAVG